MSKIQKMINEIDKLIATRPQVLAQFKAAKAEINAGRNVKLNLEETGKAIKELKRIQDLEATKPLLMEKLAESVAKVGRNMEFAGYSATQY